MTHKALKSIATTTLVVGVMALAGTTVVKAETAPTEIDLTYVWTAHPGMADQLIGTYQAVGKALEANEPGLLFYEMAISENGNQIIIHEIFEDSEALSFHLTETAAKFFPQIVEFATPGPFIFRGDVPEELKLATYNMNMGAIFTDTWEGFERK